MNRQLLAAFILSFVFNGCVKQSPPTETQVLDRRIPDARRVLASEEWRRVPNLRIQADSIEVVTLSLPSGRKVSNAVDLRRLLVSLPRTDWPYGRQALCLYPSIVGTKEDLAPASSRWMFDVLRELDITCPGIA